MDSAARQNSEIDVERWAESNPTDFKFSTKPHTNGVGDITKPSLFQSSSKPEIPPAVALKSKVGYWNARVERLAGLEARGISRVLPDEKHAGGMQDYLQMFLLWFSINMYAYNIITGFLGVLVFSLGWRDCIFIIVFANALAACGVSYTSTFGPESGNRTMVRNIPFFWGLCNP